jgi:hypothetical protein
VDDLVRTPRAGPHVKLPALGVSPGRLAGEATAYWARTRHSRTILGHLPYAPVPYSDYVRFKWEVLAHTPHRLGLEAPWFEVKKIAADDEDEQAKLVRRVVLELFDEGLIFCAHASRQDGYNLKVHEFVPVERVVVEAELSRALDYVEPEERLFWLLPTEAGLEVLDSLPAEAFLREDINVTMERIKREHPDFLEKRDQYFRDMPEWVKTGKGKRPRLPKWPE